MGVRAYVLLNVVDGKAERAVQTLRCNSGVVIADSLEGHPDIIVMVEAPDRQKLAEFLMPVIGSMDGITEDLHLLVSRDNGFPSSLSYPRMGKFKGEMLAVDARDKHGAQ